jgi:hypothetical protein
MREYDEDDDNIRLYAPVLQRVIILAAVIIAVPVMMWTITTFIRNYFERPKAPTFQHMTLSEPSQSASPASPLTASLPPPPQAAQPAAQPGPAPLLADAARTTSDGPATPPDASQGSLKAPLAPPAGPSSAGATAAPAPIPPVAAPAAIASPKAPATPTPAPPAGVAPRIAANAPGAAAAAPTDRGLAWPNPNGESAPSFGAASPQPPVTTETASAEALPASEPIKGRVPLPRLRPGEAVAAMGSATGTTTGATTTTGAATAAATGSIAPAGRVPLPRLRPADAPADTPPAPGSPYGYQPGLETGH